LRYSGIQTTWNSWWYAPWALSLISMIWAYHIRALFPAFGWGRFHPWAYARGPQRCLDRSENNKRVNTLWPLWF
jgi:hypothetical protein